MELPISEQLTEEVSVHRDFSNLIKLRADSKVVLVPREVV